MCGHGGGRTEGRVLSQLLLHVSYVFVMGHDIQILSVWNPPTNRIASKPGSCRVVCRCAGSDVDVLCDLCCAVLSSAASWGKTSKHQPGSPAGSRCLPLPPPAQQPEPSQPPAHLIDSPATRIATRHRDRFFLGCVIHACWIAGLVPHDGTNYIAT